MSGCGEIVWEGKAERIRCKIDPDGTVCLIRGTDFDSGAAQSIRIPAEAIEPLRAHLANVAAFGPCPRPGSMWETPPDEAAAWHPSGVDMGRGCEP